MYRAISRRACSRVGVLSTVDTLVLQDGEKRLGESVVITTAGASEVARGTGYATCKPTSVEDLLRPGIPGELAAVADVFCGQADLDAQFELGLDLMVRGIDTTQQNPPASTAP